ncbi:LacI family DNA-binding transcriptional regulator [Nonomuraea ferruginea]
MARLAKVSTSTASRVLGNYGRFSEATRKRVLDAIETLGYRPNSVARSMVTRRTDTLGVVCADISSPFFSGVVRGITDEARKSGYSILLTNTDEDVRSEREAVNLLIDKQVDGLIVATADVGDVEHLRAVRSHGKHVVLFDRPSSAVGADAVTVDDVAAMREAVTYLLSHGHRRIGILTELRIEREADWATLLRPGLDRLRGEINASAARLLGYLRAHRDAGVEVDPSLVGRTGGYDVEGAAEATRRLLASPARPTALVTTDNMMTLGAYQAVRELDIEMPRDLSFVGFDNLDWTTLVRPALTVIEQPVHEIGARAARKLIDRLNGDEGPPELIELPTSFLVRESVAAV